MYYIDVLKKYAVFGGRARRKEYWMFALVNIVIYVVLSLFEKMIGMRDDRSVFASVYMLAVFLPGLAVTVRRLHDTNRSGALILLNFIPLVGPIVLFVYMVSAGTKGNNRFGADPIPADEAGVVSNPPVTPTI